MISLTSHPIRFPFLEKTLKSLLLQTVAEKRLILWVALQDISQLPPAVTALKQYGLEIRETPDHGVHNKYHGALREFPDHNIILCDDDTYYWPSWAEELIAASTAHPGMICCHRAHQITLNEAGFPKPYDQWDSDIDGPAQGPLIFATGVGGVLYPPHSLNAQVLDSATAAKLCPTADDVWLYWMARLAKSQCRQIGARRQFVQWAGTQKQALWKINNIEAGNDRQIAAMANRFGVGVISDAAHDEQVAPANSSP